MRPGIGYVVRTLRLQRGLSQRDLAKKVGVSSAYIAMLERGIRKNPSFALLRRTAKTLGVAVTDLWADKVASMGESVDRLRDRLEPYWENVDGLVETDIRQLVTPAHFAHFEGVRFKLKALWYSRERLADLDADYGRLVDDRVVRKDFSTLTANADGSWSYFPFFEAVEFENLLTQSKACLDCYALAVGLVFKNQSAKLSTLVNVLRKTSSGAGLLRLIEAAERPLKGLVLDPGGGKKSLRDLITHRERAFIHFRVTTAGRSPHALLRGRHPLLPSMSNVRVTAIGDQVWHATRTLITESFPLVVKLAGTRA